MAVQTTLVTEISKLKCFQEQVFYKLIDNKLYPFRFNGIVLKFSNMNIYFKRNIITIKIFFIVQHKIFTGLYF